MPRSPKGMFRRGRSWYVRLRKQGKDRWVSLGPDYQEACRKLRRIRSGDEPLLRSTVAGAVEKWIETYVQTARNRKGVKLAQARLARYLVPALGWKLLGKVTSDDLRTYRLWLEQQGISRQTVAHVLSDARCFFGWCEDSGLIVNSPVPRKLLPRIPERPPDRLTDIEIDSLVRIADPHGFVIRFGLATGLRWGELCRAQAADIENGMIIVSRTKSGKIRRVPLRRVLQEELEGRVGKLMPFSLESNSWFTLTVRRASGVARFHTHQLRHTFACQWLEKGGSLAALQEILGHSTIVTTQRYAKLTDDIVKRESERIEGFSGKTVAETVAESIQEPCDDTYTGRVIKFS